MNAGQTSRRMQNRTISVLLVLCMMFCFLGQLGGTAQAASASLPGIFKYNGEYVASPRTVRDLFDADYYLERYPELKDLLHLSGDVNRLTAEEREILLTHFMEKGLQEERTCSPYLNLVRYRAAHPELEKEFGNDWDRYVEYYFTIGRLKGHDPFVSEEDLRIQQILLERFGREWDSDDEDDEDDDSADPEDPAPLINRKARRNITGYRLYLDPNAAGEQFVDNGYFTGRFYPDTYHSILKDSRRGAGKPEYTVMLYVCGTDLEDRVGAASVDLLHALLAKYDLSRVNVLLLAGGTKNWQNKAMQPTNDDVKLCLYYLDPGGIIPGEEVVDNVLTKDENGRTGSLRLLGSYSQACMGDSELLLGFLDTAYELFPAEHYWLSLWNHGTGSAGGICSGDEFSNESTGFVIPAKPLTLASIEEALSSSKIVKDRKNGKLDILSMEACLMGGIEEAYNFSPYVDYLIASEELTSGDTPYHMYLKSFQKNGQPLTAGELAINAAKSYISSKSGDGRNPATMSAYDLKTLAECADRMNAFGYAMSALLENKDTRAQAASFLEKSASRVFNFGHSDDAGSNYVDLYALLDRLQDYLTYGQRTAKNAEAAAMYQSAALAVTELLQVPFLVYRGGVYVNSYILNETARGNDLLSMSGSDRGGLWGKLGYDYLCGVTVYFPGSTPMSKEYAEQSIFPGYVEMLNRYTQITQSKEHIHTYKGAAWELANDYSPIFNGMKVEKCTYIDKEEREQTGLALRVTFKPDPYHSEELGDLDPATIFVQTVKKFDVAVLRSQNANTDQDPEFDDQIDIVIARSEDIYPGEGMVSEVTLDEESGLQDTSGLAFDVSRMKLIARVVAGATNVGNKIIMDYGLSHPKENELRQAAPAFAKDWKDDFYGLEGAVYTSSETQKEAILIFGKDNGGDNYTYKGAVLVTPGLGEDAKDTYELLSTEKSVAISLYHYMLKGTEIQRVEAENSGATLDIPRFSLVGQDDSTRSDLPTMTLVPMTKPDGSEILSQDYNRFALEITNDDATSVYAPESGKFNPDKYDKNSYQGGSDAQNLTGIAVQSNTSDSNEDHRYRKTSDQDSGETEDIDSAEPTNDMPSREQEAEPDAEQEAEPDAEQEEKIDIESETAGNPEPAEGTVPESEQAPSPEPESVPAPASEPASASVPEPASTPALEPASAPASEPASAPASEPASAPASEPASAPASEPASAPAFEPASTPAFEPASASVPEPASTPASEPASAPEVPAEDTSEMPAENGQEDT